MESLDSNRLRSKTDIIDVEDIECRTPSPVTSCAGSHCSISRTEVVDTTECVIEERSDVMLKLMSHLIPVSTRPENDSNGAVKLADRVAALNRRIHQERDLYLQLQDSNNRIEERDEGDLSTTDSSKTVNSTSDRYHQGQISKARARRRERLNIASAMSHRQISSDLQIFSPGLSSPEPLTLKEIREDWINEIDQLSSPIENQYSFQNDPVINLMQEKAVTGLSNSSISQGYKVADDMLSSWPNALRFSDKSYRGRNSTRDDDRISDFYSNDADYSKNGSMTEAEIAHTRAPTSSTASSKDIDYTYMTRKKTPLKFGGYRPPSGMIFRNLSSDSESDVTIDQVIHRELRSQKYRQGNKTHLDIRDTEKQELHKVTSSNFPPGLDRMTEVEAFSIEKNELLDGRMLSPIPSVDSRQSPEDGNPDRKIETRSEHQNQPETDLEPIASSGKDCRLDDRIETVTNQNTLVDANAGCLHIASGVPNDKFIPEKTENSEDFSNQSRSQSYVLADNHHMHPKIPLLEIDSQDYPQSHFLSSENRGDKMTDSSLDVNALIKALSDVSLKQNNSINCSNPCKVKLQSTFEYGNRSSGPSGPRSSEYTPAAGGSRQSLTSLDISETCSVKINKEESRAQSQTTPILKSDKRNIRSARKTLEVSKEFSRPVSNTKKSPVPRSLLPEEPNSEIYPPRGSGFIPVIAKVNRTSLVSSKHPLIIKSIGRLISPRKYRNTNTGGVIADPLTTRTDVSQSSDGSRKSFRSLRSVQPVTRLREKKIGDSKAEIDSRSLSAPLSARRVLKPLNSVPKIKTDLLTSMNEGFERRRKTANDLAEIINSPIGFGNQRATTKITSRYFSRRGPLSRTNTSDSEGSHLSQCREEPVIQQECSAMNDNRVSMLHHERLSLSSGDYGGKGSWSPSPRDQDLTESENTHDSGNQLHVQRQPLQGSSNLTPNSHASSFANCVHSNDLRGGREVTMTSGNTKHREGSLKVTELFDRLPNEISGSLTRHPSFGNQVTETLVTTKETPRTIGDLRKEIQENNNRWIEDLKTNDVSENSLPGLVGDEISSTSSLIRCGKSQSQNLLSNSTKISLVGDTESSCSPSCVAHKIDDGECLSPLDRHKDITREFAYNSEAGQPDSQKSSVIHSGDNSHQNAYRGIAQSSDSTVAIKCDETLDCEFRSNKFFEPNANDSYNFEEEQAMRAGRDIKSGVIQVSLDSPEETITQKDDLEFPFLPDALDTSDTGEKDEETVDLVTNVKINPDDELEIPKAVPSEIAKFEKCMIDAVPSSRCELKLGNFEQDSEENEKKYFDQRNQSTNDSGDTDACGKIISPTSNKSVESKIMPQHHQDRLISSPPVSIKSFLSMSKLNSSADSKWDVTVTTGANSLKRSQDRFPFTISESTSRKISKFKVDADISLDKLTKERNAHAENNDEFSSLKPILAKSGDQKIAITDTNVVEKRRDCCDDSSINELAPFFGEFTNKICNNLADDWEVQMPFMNLNYISYGCHEEPRTLMPTVKEMVKKLSAKLRYTKTKRCLDHEETKIEILYRNQKCLCESGDGSSSATSMYQSQLPDTSHKLVPNFGRRKNKGSIASSRKAMKPKRNYDRSSMSLQHNPRKGCDQNDLWIQEFDSDVEFDSQTSAIAYCHMQNDFKREAMPRTSSPVLQNDRYSMFLARSKFFGIINDPDCNERCRMDCVLKCCEGGDSEKVHSKERPRNVDGTLIEVPEVVSSPLRTPANSVNYNTDEDFKIDEKDDNIENSTAVRSGCCCFRFYHFFIRSGKSRRKIRERNTIFKKK